MTFHALLGNPLWFPSPQRGGPGPGCSCLLFPAVGGRWGVWGWRGLLGCPSQPPGARAALSSLAGLGDGQAFLGAPGQLAYPTWIFSLQHPQPLLWL